MPFSGIVFSNVVGASSAAPGQTVQSTIWNNIHIDYEAAFTQLNAQYSSLPTSRNALWMNGGLEVWQRGAGNSSSISVAASTAQYTADRWFLNTGANQASTVAAAAGLVTNSYRCAKLGRNAGQTGTTQMLFGYPLDTPEIQRLKGNFVTISAVLKAGASFSGGTITIELVSGPSDVPSKATGGTYTSNVTLYSLTTTVSASVNTLISGVSSVIVPTNTTAMQFQIRYTPTGTAGADETIYIDDVSVEPVLSSYQWTTMSYDRLPFEVMLQGCKRYFQKTFDYSVAPANALNTVAAANSLNNSFGGVQAIIFQTGSQTLPVMWNLPVELRTAPGKTGNFTVYNPVQNSNSAYCITTNVSITVNATDLVNAGSNGISFDMSQVTTSVAPGQAYLIYIQAIVTAGL